jgi:Fe-S-cluster-containing dehydrogenase component
MSQNRREFLKTISALGAGVAAVSTLTPKNIEAKNEGDLNHNRMGVLVDATVCIGCRKCEWACKGSHDFSRDSFDSFQNDETLDVKRRPSADNLTVVNKYIGDSERTIKLQCMHCDYPACVSACIVGAITKKETGAVVWDTDKCIGCRYCMVACPFQIPAFEYEKALDPKIVKCDFCVNRTENGKIPACVDICPVEALTYGTREELLAEAKRRIKNHPEKYYDHIFGEYEIGGTSWLYLADKDLAGLVFPKLGSNPAPGVSESIQHGLFAYFVPPIAVYALLGGIMWLTKDKENKEENK